jgi:hypothetical protein
VSAPTDLSDNKIGDSLHHILTRQFLGGKYSKWIIILQEFDLEFERAKSKKSLVFVKLICDLPCSETENVAEDSLPDESLFLISSDDLWYGDIIIYLQTKTFHPNLSSTDVVEYTTKPVSILSSVILFIIVGLTPFFDATSRLIKPRKP